MPADSPVTASLPSATVPALAPAKKAPFSPAHFLARLVRLDNALIVLVVVLAFLLASFPVTNSDMLQHFAVGRLVLEGKYQFGVDPFCFTTDGVYWANHSWLFGVIAYGLYSIPTIGGVVLVVVKALLVALLAVVMLRSAWRSGERFWVPAAITALAVVALSPRLFLQPVILSYLFLSLTIWFLIRPAPQTAVVREQLERKKKVRAAGKPIPFQAYWRLPVFCMLWVNLDQWFLLGPLTIGLYLLGVALQDRFLPLARTADTPVEEPKTLGLVLLASLTACLVSPHHFRAFVLPPQLGFNPAAETLHDDRMFFQLFLSPLSTESNNHYSYFNPNTGLNVAGMAYFPLLLLGLLSFGMTFGRWRLWRAVVWLFFFVLSLYHARAIPFFAVVAAPITALNFLDWVAGCFGAAYHNGANARTWAVGGRVLTLFVVLLLVVAAVPGWTQATPHYYRHVGWGVAFDPTLTRAAQQVADWRKEGQLPADVHWFNTSPDLANYFAWFCPGEKTFLDHRLSIFDEVAEDYVKMRKALLPPTNSLPPPHQFPTVEDLYKEQEFPALAELLEKHRIGIIACYENTMRRTVYLERLLANPGQWPRIYNYGRVAYFGRLAPNMEKKDARLLRALIVSDAHQAFGPNVAAAPRHRPTREPQTLDFIEHLWKPRRPLYNPDLDEALQHYHVYRTSAQSWRRNNFLRLEMALAASLMGRSYSGSPGLLETAWQSQLFFPTMQLEERPNNMQVGTLNFHHNYLTNSGTLDNGPPASLYLALRAARRALHRNPDEELTYFLLAQIYIHLSQDTREGGFSPYELRDVRLAQIFGTLHQAIRLNPDLEEAHFMLAEQYERLGWIDLMAKHRREYLRCLKEGPVPPRDLEEREKKVEALEAEVQRLQDTFLVMHGNKKPLEQAQIALTHPRDGGFGLAETTLKALKEIDFQKLGRENRDAVSVAAQLQFDLLFLKGELAEIRDTLHSMDDLALGNHPQTRLPAVRWCRIRLAAAAGDYQEADELLEKALQEIVAQTNHTVAARLIGDILLHDGREATGQFINQAVADVVVGRLPRMNYVLQTRDVILDPGLREANVRVLRGWLALEAGDNRTAAAQFRAGLTLSWPPERSLPVLAILGATSPIEAVAAVNMARPFVHGRQFDFNFRRLAVMGLEWLAAQEN